MGSTGESLRDLTRAAGGGLLVGLEDRKAARRGVRRAVGDTTLTGFRRERSWAQLGVDTVEAFGIAAAISVVALVVLGRIDASSSLQHAVGQVSLETDSGRVGVSFALAQLGAPEDGESIGGSRAGSRAGSPRR